MEVGGSKTGWQAAAQDCCAGVDSGKATGGGSHQSAAANFRSIEQLSAVDQGEGSPCAPILVNLPELGAVKEPVLIPIRSELRLAPGPSHP